MKQFQVLPKRITAAKSVLPLTASKYHDDWKHVTDMHIYSANPLDVEASLNGADYVSIYFDTNTNKYYIEDPFDGVTATEDTAEDIVDQFCDLYVVSPKDWKKLRSAI